MQLINKFKEVVASVLPIIVIVLLLNFTITPLPKDILGLFLIGTLFLIIGMGLFMLGADIGMLPMGEIVGSEMTKSRRLSIIIVFGFLIGFLVTIAEPDLQVLASQVANVNPAVGKNLLIIAVSAGSGIFVVIGLVRIIVRINLSKILVISYLILFILAAFTPEKFLTVAFDSGGVTTGSITVPFILALGVGVSAVRGGNSSSEDSFGLVALASIGPVLIVVLLGLIFNGSSGSEEIIAGTLTEVNGIKELMLAFIIAMPLYAKEVTMALGPIFIMFVIFKLLFLKMSKKQFRRILVGIIYTFIGLVFFLTGVNVGFVPAGTYLGGEIAGLSYNWIIIPVGMIIGFCVVAAEPAVHVLNSEVEEVSGGYISKKSMLLSLSIGVTVSVGLSMIRVMAAFSIWWILMPGYSIALLLSFFVPKMFTAIAFDSGGIASGSMTATFILPFTMGACERLGGNILTDAFGVVATVAMIPLITIQLLGLIYKLKIKQVQASSNVSVETSESKISKDEDLQTETEDMESILTADIE